MFILTNISVKDDSVRILDTNDRTKDVVNLSALARKIRGNKFKVYGLKRLSNASQKQDVIVIPQLGIVVDQIEAREALARFYMDNGVDQITAYKQVGLN